MMVYPAWYLPQIRNTPDPDCNIIYIARGLEPIFGSPYGVHFFIRQTCTVKKFNNLSGWPPGGKHGHSKKICYQSVVTALTCKAIYCTLANLYVFSNTTGPIYSITLFYYEKKMPIHATCVKLSKYIIYIIIVTSLCHHIWAQQATKFVYAVIKNMAPHLKQLYHRSYIVIKLKRDTINIDTVNNKLNCYIQSWYILCCHLYFLLL